MNLLKSNIEHKIAIKHGMKFTCTNHANVIQLKYDVNWQEVR
jgi:hypothetical protein